MNEPAYILSVKRMKTKGLFYKRKLIVQTIVAFGGIFLALRFRDECYRGMEKGIELCLGTLIPSLFFFMVAAAYITQSGFAETVCRPLEKVSERLFGLPSVSLSVILLAMIGGYPVGASCAAILYKENRLSPSQAAKTTYIAVAAGPGFLVSYIGGALLHSTAAGYILLGSQAIAVIMVGIIVGHTVKSEPLPHFSPRHRDGGSLLVGAVQSASNAAFGMCAMVVIFCALSEICDTFITDQTLRDIAAAITEITNGCSRISDKVPLYVTAFFVGFGGLSVHFQIYAAVADLPLKKGLFFLFRIIEGIIMMAATYIYLMVAPKTITVFNSVSSVPTVSRSATIAGSAALVISSLLFIGSVTKRSILIKSK